MTSLRETILKSARPEKTETIDGVLYLVVGVSELEGSQAEAIAISDGKLDGGKLRREILIRSLHDPETKQRVFEDHESDLIENVPRHITGKLFSLAMKLGGYDKDDDQEAKLKN